MNNAVATRSTSATSATQQRGRFSWRTIAARLLGSTPVRFRTTAAVAAVALVVFAAVGLTTARDRGRATAHLRDHAAPTLIAAQDVSSSLAEADAAAVSAFLSGAKEDRDARALYQRSLERVSGSLEQASRLIGDDPPAHVALVRATNGMLSYAGLVESARTAHAASLSDASTRLSAASAELTTTVKPAVDELAVRASVSVDADHRAATRGLTVMTLSGTIALAALVALGVLLSRRTRRLLNPGVAIATAAIAVMLVWSTLGAARQSSDIDRALGGTRAGVETIAKLRTAAYTVEASRSRALVDGTSIDLVKQLATVAPALLSYTDTGTLRTDDGLLGSVATLSTAARQQAEAAEMVDRWVTYRSVVLGQNLVASDANAAFTGFNIAVDNVLASQQARFLAQIGQARARLNHLDPWVAVAAIVALALLVLGVERRAGEYR